MAENAEETQKVRRRMEKDAYSVLLSFRDGANINMLERRMDEVLGYTYHNKYYQGGVHDMEQLLLEHPQIQHLGGKSFRIIPIEECSDLADLVSKQKDGCRRNKISTMPSRTRRPHTSTGSHPTFSLRSPKGLGGLRPLSAFGRDNTSSFGACRPLMSIPFPSRPTVFPEPVSAPNNNFGQRPLRRPAITPSTFNNSFTEFDGPPREVAPIKVPFGTPPKELRSVKPASRVPSIKEFSENTKKMMTAVQPKPVHLSKMGELYTKEFGVSVDPLQLFSKSWKMLIQTTFKDWLEINAAEDVRMKLPSRPQTPFGFNSQGFSYQVRPIMKTPMKKLECEIKDLSVSLLKVVPTLPTPEKPPGLSNNNPAPGHLLDLLRPKSSCSMKAPISPIPPTFPNPIIKPSGYLEYDATYMQNLKLVKKSDGIKEYIAHSLEVFPELCKEYVKMPINRRSSGGNRRVRASHNSNTRPVFKTEHNTPSALFTAPNSRNNSPPESSPVHRTFGQGFGQGFGNVKKEIKSPGLEPTSFCFTPSQTPESMPTSPEEKPLTRRAIGSKLPPMSKGNGMSAPPPLLRPASRASSRMRLVQDAKLPLPDDDDWW